MTLLAQLKESDLSLSEWQVAEVSPLSSSEYGFISFLFVGGLMRFIPGFLAWPAAAAVSEDSLTPSFLQLSGFTKRDGLSTVVCTFFFSSRELSFSCPSESLPEEVVLEPSSLS